MSANNAPERRQLLQLKRGTNSNRYSPRDGGMKLDNYLLDPQRSLTTLAESPQTAVPAGALSGRGAPLNSGTNRSIIERDRSTSINSVQEVRAIVNVKKIMVKKGITLSLGNFENKRVDVMMEAEIQAGDHWDEATAELAARVNSVLMAEAEPYLSLMCDAQREDWLVRFGQLPTAKQIDEGLQEQLANSDPGTNPADGPYPGYRGDDDDKDDDGEIEHLRADDDGMPPSVRVIDGDLNETLQ